MKKLLIIAALLPTLLFGQQAKNVQVASGETFDENNIIVGAGGARAKSIPIVWSSGNSTLSLTGNITLTGNVVANGIGGATVNGQVLLGNATSGDFQIGNITAGSGISLTPGAGTLQVSANQSLFQSVKVSGQNDIIATSPTANITFSATGGLVATTNNTTNTITFDASGISSGGAYETGDVKFILDSASVPSGWALTGENGIQAFTTPDADYKAIMKMAGTVATPTFSPVAGAVATGATINFSSATSGVTFMATTNGTDPSRSVGTAGASMVVSANTTIEVMAYKDGAYLIDSAVASAAYTIDPVPTVSTIAINADGTSANIVFSESVSYGAGGSTGWTPTLSGGAATWTYTSGTGTANHTFTINRTVTNAETGTLAYTNPGNGAEDSALQDLANFSGISITNNSAQAGGAAYVDEVLADSPLGYWRLGETSGTSAADLGSVNQAGTYSGGYTLNQTSLLTSDTANKSVLLNGSTGYIGGLTSSSFARVGSHITVECLVNFSAFPASGSEAWFIGKAYDGGSEKTGYALRLAVTGGGSTKTLHFSTYDGSTSPGTSYDVSAWTTGTTYHIAGTWDGADWKLYVNGSNVATTADAAGPQSSGRALNIGRESNSFADQSYLNGTIDEVAIYNTALSAARILAHHNAR